MRSQAPGGIRCSAARATVHGATVKSEVRFIQVGEPKIGPRSTRALNGPQGNFGYLRGPVHTSDSELRPVRLTRSTSDSEVPS